MARFCLILATILCFFIPSSLEAQQTYNEKLRARLKQPLVAPKPLLFWVERLSHPDADVRQEAMEFFDANVERIEFWEFPLDEESIESRAAFRRQYQPILPALIHHLRNAESSLSDGNTEATPSFRTVRSILDLLGTNARAAIPELQRVALNDNLPYKERIRCALTLLAITPEDNPVGPLFVRILDSMPASIRQEMEQFYHIEKLDADAEQRLHFCIGMASTIFSVALMESGHTTSEVPTMVRIARGTHPALIRAVAIVVLGKLSFDAQAAVPELQKLLKDEDPLIQKLAARSLIMIEDDDALIPETLSLLKLDRGERDEFKQEMQELLDQRRGRAKQLLSETAQWVKTDSNQELWQWMMSNTFGALRSGNGFRRRQTIQTLGYIGPSAEAALPDLRKALNDPDEDTRRMAAEAIRKVARE